MNSDGLCFPLRRWSPGWPAWRIMSKVGNVVQCPTLWLCCEAAQFWYNSSPLLTSLGSVCSCPNKQAVYLYTKQTALKSRYCSFWSAEELCHSFARSETLYFSGKLLWSPYWTCLFLFLHWKLICSILSLKCGQSWASANSTGVLKLSRERRGDVLSSAGLMLCWVFFSNRNVWKSCL